LWTAIFGGSSAFAVTKCWSFAGWVAGMLMIGGFGNSSATEKANAIGTWPLILISTLTRSP